MFTKHFILLISVILIVFLTSIQSKGQVVDSFTLNIGDAAPKIEISKWLKCTPLHSFEPGKLYVIEFWPTWCKPCIASMPHLSEFARNHANEISVISIAVYEKNMPLNKIQKFVDSMGNRMDFSVAVDKNQQMVENWLQATGNTAIPKIFIINEHGQIAWFGHPYYLDSVVAKIMNHQWDIQKASAEVKMQRHLNKFIDSIQTAFFDYAQAFNDSEINVLQNQYHVTNLFANSKKPDKVLFYMNKFIQQEPGIKYDEYIVMKKLQALIKINMQEALEYAKEILNLPPDKVPASAIILVLKNNQSKYKFSQEMNAIGAEAYEIYIKHIIYPDLVHTLKYYHEMTEFYWLAKNKDQAIDSEINAIRILKNHPDFSPDLSAFP